MEGEDYLSTPIFRATPGDFDILKWWQDNKAQYPRLAQVAKDILSVPITGVGVERVFNVTKDIINDRRHRLNAETIRKLTMMRDQYQRTLDTEPLESADNVDNGNSLEDLYTLPVGEGSFSAEDTDLDSDANVGDTNSDSEDSPRPYPPQKRRRTGL